MHEEDYTEEEEEGVQVHEEDYTEEEEEGVHVYEEDYTEEESEPGAKVGLSCSMLDTSCWTAWLSDPGLPQALLTAPSACSRDAPDSSSHLGDSGSHACSSQKKE